MARKSSRAETESMFTMFLDQTTERLMNKIKNTRQFSRRREYLNRLDALDGVKAEFYDWLNGLDAQT